MTAEKMCTTCGDPKPIGEFSKAGVRRRASCKLCDNTARSARVGQVPLPQPLGITQEECARRSGLSRTRVRQIEARAIAKMRAGVSEEWR